MVLIGKIEENDIYFSEATKKVLLKSPDKKLHVPILVNVPSLEVAFELMSKKEGFVSVDGNLE